MRMIALTLCFFLSCSPAFSEARLALVIGNSGYDAEAGGSLPNPVKDANLVAEALQEVGFTVQVETDLDDKGLKRAIRDHRKRLEQAGDNAISFFYYAGHGANDRIEQFGGTNYLIPINADIRSVSDLDIEAVELGDAIRAFSTASINFVVFDACRNFPFPESDVRSITRGFVSEPERKGTFIAFSSEPGSVAFDDSGYARSLAAALKQPGMNHRDVFTSVRAEVYQSTDTQQFAWYRDGILGDVRFNDTQDIDESTHPTGESSDIAAFQKAIAAYRSNDFVEAAPDFRRACDAGFQEGCTVLAFCIPMASALRSPTVLHASYTRRRATLTMLARVQDSVGSMIEGSA